MRNPGNLSETIEEAGIIHPVLVYSTQRTLQDSEEQRIDSYEVNLLSSCTAEPTVKITLAPQSKKQEHMELLAIAMKAKVQQFSGLDIYISFVPGSHVN